MQIANEICSQKDVYVLDTHILVWYFTGNARLKQEVRERIDLTRSQGGRLLVPTIVLVEALNISEKGRVELDFDEMYRLIQAEPEFEIVGFGVEIFKEVIALKKIREIHDRIIVATARFYETGILTRDKIITMSGEVVIL